MDGKEYKKISKKIYLVLGLGCLTFVFWIILAFTIPSKFAEMNFVEKVALIGSLIYPVVWFVLLLKLFSSKQVRDFEKHYWIKKSKSQLHKERAKKVYKVLSVPFFLISGTLGLAGWITFLQPTSDFYNQELNLFSKIILIFLLLYTITFITLLVVRASIKHSQKISSYYSEEENNKVRIDKD